MQNPQLYDPQPQTVEIIQTHISAVFLTGTYAYKIKKPVDFGFLDFSTLEKRKHFCSEEIRLNKRLAPDIYLEVVPITKEQNHIVINGSGTPVEYAVKMKQFPQKNIMTTQLQQHKITKQTIEELGNILIGFYIQAAHNKEIDSYGKPESVQQNIDENFEQTQNIIGTVINKETYTFIKKANDTFFTYNKNLFDQRIKEDKIRECHGDLHSGNIVISTKPIVFDCIEFNKRFRYIDIASDIGFLAMDLDYQNHPYLSSHLIHHYLIHSNDTTLHNVLNFYKSYRAYVRGKVIGFQLNDPHIETDKKQTLINIGKKYFEFSHYYASLFLQDLQQKKPLLMLVGGLSGTGKSTIAQKLAIDYHAILLNTDVVRKKIHNIDIYEKHHDAPNTGLYNPKKVEETYKKVLELAEQHLKEGHNVVLDATFQQQKHRTHAHQLAQHHNSQFLQIQCICDEDVIQQRLQKRVQEQNASDARWEIYLQQKKTFEPFQQTPYTLLFDTGNTTYDHRLKTYKKIQHILSGAHP